MHGERQKFADCLEELDDGVIQNLAMVFYSSILYSNGQFMALNYFKRQIQPILSNF
jgi:hypothetical protein